MRAAMNDEVEKTTYCPHCGEKVQGDAFFCHKCGHLTERGSEEGAHYPRSGRPYWFGCGDARYVAEESKAFTGEVTMDRLSLEVENINGPTRITTWDKPEYSIGLLIEAKGYTREEAEENLKLLETALDDRVDEGQQRLALRINYPRNTTCWYKIDIEVTVPKGCELDTDIDSKNGRIVIEGVKGGVLNAETKNGRIALRDLTANEIGCSTKNGRLILDHVSAGFIKGRSSNGKIEGELESMEASLSTSNGRIDLTLPCNASGGYELRTSNGSIDLATPKTSNVGFDLDTRTSHGRINLDLPDLEYARHRKNRKVAMTRGFDGKAVQIAIKAVTSLGKIWIN